jgi:uncharacterized membrane protein
MEDSRPIHEHVEQWYSQGKIDRATYERLLADCHAEPKPPADEDPRGLVTGLGGLVLGLGLIYLVGDRFAWIPFPVFQVSLLLAGVLAAAAVLLAQRTRLQESGRALAIAASLLWVQANFNLPVHLTPIQHLFLLSGGLVALAYVANSAVVLFQATVWVSILVATIVNEFAGWPNRFGVMLTAHILLGALYVAAAREHLGQRLPAGVAARRFAFVYQVVGLSLINWSAMLLGWYGWTGDGYHDVGMRMAGATVTVVLYGLEAWVGRSAGMIHISLLGISHFLAQILALLWYPYVSDRQRGLIIFVLGLLMILLSLGGRPRDNGDSPSQTA